MESNRHLAPSTKQPCSRPLAALAVLATCALLSPRPALAAPPDELASPVPPGAPAYLAKLGARIQPRWHDFVTMLLTMPKGSRYHDDRALATELELAVDADGTLEDVQVLSRSGLKGFDSAPVELIRDLGRLPTPPDSLRSDDGYTYVRWRFDRAEDGGRTASVERRGLAPEVAIPRMVETGRLADARARVASLLKKDPQTGRRAVSILAEALAKRGAKSHDPAERAAAATALAHVPFAESTLLSLSGDDDPGVRLAALDALGQAPRSAYAVERLERFLGPQSSWNERIDPADQAAAMKALGGMGDKGAVPLLLGAIRSDRQPVAAAHALVALGDAADVDGVLGRMLGAGADDAALAVRIDGELHDRALVPALEAAFARPNADDALRAGVVAAIAATKDADPVVVRSFLLRALAAHSATVRVATAVALGTLDNPSKGVLYRLLDGMKDPDPAVRVAAATSFATRAAERMPDDVAAAAHGHDPAVRAAVAAALAKLHAAPAPVASAEPVASPSPIEGLLHADELGRLRAAAAWLKAENDHAAARPDELRVARLAENH